MQQNQNESTVKPIAVSGKKVKHAAQTAAMLGVLVALGIICSMSFPYGLTIRIGTIGKISLSFIVIAMAARKYGVIASSLVAFMIDFIQAMIFGFGFNPLISLSSTLVGVFFGLFFHRENISLKRILLCVGIETVVCTMFLTTLALSLMGSEFLPLLYTRTPQAVVMFILKIAVLYLMFTKTNILKRIHFI